MQTPAHTGKPAATIQPPRTETGLLWQELDTVPHCTGKTVVVAHSRHLRAGNPAMVSIVVERPYTHYEVFEPHAARALAANLIRAAEIADRHNMDADRHAERRALAAAIDQANAPAVANLLHRAGRLNTRQDLVGNFAGIAHTCVGVEIHPLGSAPVGEIVRINVHADDPQSFDLLSFAAGFGCPQPLIVGPMEFVTVLEHGAQAGEILRLEPGHADDLHLGSHPRALQSERDSMVAERETLVVVPS